jgi:succinyl-diaminopimelate desuccinylase
MNASSLRDELTGLTCDLVAIPSVAGRPEALQAAIDYAERYARAVPGVRLQRYQFGDTPSLVVTLRDTRRPAVILNAHLDVVPGLPEQFAPAVRGGRIYGRGSQDMKGSGAVLLRLLKDLAALPEPPDVGFQFVSDEEIGGMLGTHQLLNDGWECGFFIAAEPTDLRICNAHKGAMWVEVEFHGRAAHGSRPWEGKNALMLLAHGLVALERRFPTPDEEAWVTTVVPSVVAGGDAGNRVADRARLTLDIRHLPEERPDDILAALREIFAPGSVAFQRGGAPLFTAPDHPGVRRLAACVAAETGAPAGFMREHFATDARFYSSAGIPAVCIGPVGAGLHSDEEWVEIASLERLYHILWRFVVGAKSE